MAEKPKIDDDEHDEGNHTEAPADTGNRDTEPDSDVIPHSAKAMSDYHDGLKDLTAAAEHHHGEFLKEMKKHHGAMEHMTLKKHFGNWLEEHEKALNDMLETHKHLQEDMQRKFKKYHPDLEPLDKDADEEEDLPTGSKPTSEPRASRTEREEAPAGAAKSQPTPAPDVPVAAPTPPVATKATPAPAAAPAATKTAPAPAKTPANPDELSEEDAAVFLHVIGQIRKDQKELRRDFERSVG